MTTVPTSRLIAIIDSDDKHRNKLSRALTSFYDMKSWADGKSALADLSYDVPTLILVNATIDPSGPVALIQELRQQEALKDTPIVYIAESEIDPKIKQAKAAGADGYFSKPYPRSVLLQTISQKLNAYIEHEWETLPDLQRSALQKSVGVFHDIADVLLTGETISFQHVKDSTQPLVTAIENNDFQSILAGVRDHDDYTYAHSMRVATMLSLLGHAAGFKNDEQLLLASGGLLHDVGKMMIPHHILNKPGRLDEEEFEIIKTHVPETVNYLKGVGNIPQAVFIIAEQHHEKIDGTGYPYGLQGKELNELARMAAVVDVFSALTDRRIYKPPMEAEKAINIMREDMTGHLDQNYVKMFKTILHDAKIM